MSSPPKPRPITASSPSQAIRSQSAGGDNRSLSNARLASPVPSADRSPRGSIGQRPTGNVSPLPGLDGSSDLRFPGQPGQSALATALSASLGRSPPRQIHPTQETGQRLHRSGSFAGGQSTLGSAGVFGPGLYRSHRGSRGQSPSKESREDFNVVRRHLVQPTSASVPASGAVGLQRHPRRISNSSGIQKSDSNDTGIPALSDGFSSLQMKGGDVHRGIYRRTEAEDAWQRRRLHRSHSVDMPKQDAGEQEMNAEQIREPGGFRREHILRNTPVSTMRNQVDGAIGSHSPVHKQQNLLTRNFFEFLSLYGHFAGEEYEDDEDYSGTGSGAATLRGEDSEEPGQRDLDDERQPLLTTTTTSKRRRKDTQAPKSGTGGTILILLKSFVGTGVLFLPRAFLNGGMAFSVGILLLVAALSYYCFLLLTTSRLKLKGSYAEMGEMCYGKPLRALINTSLVISQIGFASAYIVFTSENLRAFVLAVSKGKTSIDIKLMILMQLIIFLPLSLYRNLNSLSYVVYIADLFIVLGLVYLYYYDVATMTEFGVADIKPFNAHDWTLFVGTAIFTFEGIGLIIPIQDGMRKPQKLPSILLIVMLIIGTIFISMGALSYAAYGSKTQTVIIKNMRQDNKFVNGVQFMYSLAILLSTPMQIFPAITILEKGLFLRSGKHSKQTKWRKNIFRFMIVMLCALIAWIGAADLDKFVALVGSFACIPLVYIYPPLVHRQAVAESSFRGLTDILVCIFGFVLMAYTSALTVMSWVGGSKQHTPHGSD